MKKLLILVLAIFIGHGYCSDGFHNRKTKYVTTADTARRILLTNLGDKLVGVFVGDCGGPAAELKIYDSSATENTAELLFTLDLTSTGATGDLNCPAFGMHEWNVPISSGLTYMSTVTAGGTIPKFTIIWENLNSSTGPYFY